jgi:hypothetical protein
VLVVLLQRADRIPLPAPPERRRGRLRVYPNRLFLQALVIMILRRLRRVHTLLAMLAAPAGELLQRRRRLAGIPEILPAQIGWLGRHLGILRAPGATRLPRRRQR